MKKLDFSLSTSTYLSEKSTNFDFAPDSAHTERSQMTLKQIVQNRKVGVPSVKQERIKEQRILNKKITKQCLPKQSQKWSDGETLIFYKLIQIFGTNFQLMANIHQQRSRKQIKSKFRKEEKLNSHQIEKSLVRYGRSKFLKLHQRLSAFKDQHNTHIEERGDTTTLSQFIRQRCNSFQSVDSVDLGLVEDMDQLLKIQN